MAVFSRDFNYHVALSAELSFVLIYNKNEQIVYCCYVGINVLLCNMSPCVQFYVFTFCFKELSV
jgi:hypothetical protein